jgi:hypothetical protein
MSELFNISVSTAVRTKTGGSAWTVKGTSRRVEIRNREKHIAKEFSWLFFALPQVLPFTRLNVTWLGLALQNKIRAANFVSYSTFAESTTVLMF